MSPTNITRWLLALALGPLLSACAAAPPPPPAITTLSRTFGLVDPVGNRAGTVVLEPVGNGVIYDNGGRVIGTVVPPAPTN
jgi:hypothetical protein